MKFEQITLWTSRLDALYSFYMEQLGFPVLARNEQSFTAAIGSTQLTFRETSDHTDPFYHFAINIPENKLAEAKSWLKGKVALIEEEGRDEVFFTSWNAGAVYFADPAGNIIEFIARHQLKNGTAHPFSCSDCLEISELGIVAAEVIPVVREINALGIPNWREDSEGFTPVGDEHGLFIVVKQARKWYFSGGRQAQFYPAEVAVASIGRIEFPHISQMRLLHS
ncbi:ring-cleaving dioxygenase [Paenibacillus sp. BIHB 4019]|uniref:Ring-cleaving dioxygenase n=1 Tax=Paenibacillus sp. BIHB 4019 TaxID=1870819 RepID=A0A1B2DNE3_9BACL|nr:VOC family protein [Paenibacillus sp. BIHB 4019]ANY69223.1 ring-cleaving dioxygenase [Paenibacillus sp. BIHB 4019]